MWNQLDLSFKKLVNRVTTSSAKQYYEEFGDNTININKAEIWDQLPDPNPATAVTDGIASAYTLYTLTEDITVPNQQAYYAGSTFSTRLKNWISPKYGSLYQIQLFDNSNNPIDQTNAVDWYFDYATGIITFNGSTSGFVKPFKVTGYVYTGTLGVSTSSNAYLEQAFTSQTSVTVNHNWNTKPVVIIEDLSGEIIIGDVTYIDLDNVLVEFSLPQTGTIILQTGIGGGSGGSGATTLSALTDVTITTPSNNDALIYQSGSSKWENLPLSSMYIALDGSSTETTGNIVIGDTYGIIDNTSNAALQFSSGGLYLYNNSGSFSLSDNGSISLFTEQEFGVYSDTYIELSGSTELRFTTGSPANYNSLYLDVNGFTVESNLFKLRAGSGPSIYGNIETTNLTVSRSYQFPDNDGIIALLSDITNASDEYVKFDSYNYIIVKPDTNALFNGIALMNAVVAAQSKTPNASAITPTNRVVIYLLPGVYYIGLSNLTITASGVDIYGLGSPESVTIINDSVNGTITINSGANNYGLYNLTLKNNNSGTAPTIQINNATDNSTWDNLILMNPTTQDITYAGTYNKINATAINYVLGGTISGTVTNSNFKDYSCGYSNTTNVTISGKILNCNGGTGVFGYSSNDVTISGTIVNSVSTGDAFGFGKNITISGTIDSCTANSGFGFSTGTLGTHTINFTSSSYIFNCYAVTSPAFGYGAVNMTFDGIMRDCRLKSVGFGQSGVSADITFNGQFYNCTSYYDPAFGHTGGNIVFSSSALMDNCTTRNGGFMNSNGGTCTFDGIIQNCKLLGSGTGFGYGGAGGTMSGTIDNCLFENGYGYGNNLSISGTIKNCIGLGSGTGSYFGVTTSTGKLINCVATAPFKGGYHLGLIDGCSIVYTSTIDLSNPCISIGAGATIKNSTFINTQTPVGDAIEVASGASVSIYRCSMNKAPNTVSGNSWTNLIATPYNVVDANITK